MSPIFSCPSCGTPARPDSKFCASCGGSLTGGPALTGNRWVRTPGDFATRVEVDDVQGFFKKGLIVEEGTRALFITNGAFSGIVEAGKHEMGGLLQRINNVFSSKKTSAILVDAADVEIAFTIDQVQTSDPLRLKADCHVVLRIDESPVAFFTNLMKGQQSYPLSAVKQFLEVELRDAVQEFVGGRSANDLSSNLAVKQAMEQTLAAHLSRTLERKGLQLVQIRVLDLRHPRLAELTGKLEEYWLDAQELKTRLAGGAMSDGIERKVLDQETAKALMELEVYEERVRVYERMREAVSKEEQGKLRSASAMEDFIADIDKRKVLRDEDVSTLKRAAGERGEDHAVARQHLLATLKVNQDAEVERLQLIGKLSLQGTVAEAMRSEDLKQFDLGLEKKRRDFALKREQERLEMEDDFRDAGIGLDLLAKMKGIQGDEADREQRRVLDAERDRHARDLERFRQLAELGPDALLAFAPADRAPILAELRKTELLKGMSEGQILAMAAEKSGAVAEALKEKFRGEAGRELAERMIADKDRVMQEQAQTSRAHAEQLERFATRAMDTMRDTAVAATRAGQPGMTVVTPGMSAGVVHTAGGGPSGRAMVCPECRRDVPAGNNFCDNCGHKFLG